MPAQRKSGRGKKTGQALSENPLKKPEITAHRPRTRAWVKQEEEREEAIPDPSKYHSRTKRAPSKQAQQPERTQTSWQPTHGTTAPSLLRRGEAADRTAATKAQQNTEKRTEAKRVPQAIRKRTSQGRHFSKEPVEGAHSRESRVPTHDNPTLSAWLDRLQTASPEVSRPIPPSNNLPIIGYFSKSEDSMDSSSSTSAPSGAVSEGPSTIKQSRPSKSVTEDKLRLRRIEYEEPTEDRWSRHFRSVLHVKPVRIHFKDTKNLQSILKKFLHQCEKARPQENSYAAIEDLFNEINACKSDINLVSITNREFEMDVKYCKKANEAVLQRTVMMSIIERWQPHKFFVYNCEGQWKLPAEYYLPARSRDEITLPKPDLAISYTLAAFTGPDTSSPIPNEISKCMRPDGGVGRCFPFLFIEAKRQIHDLVSASMANLHSASQALFNIYMWMSQAGHKDIFFDRVRVFSIVLNTVDFNVRSHRAILVPNSDALSFHYDDLLSFSGYNRDQACLLVRNILTEYGEKELYGILKTTFEEVSRQEEEIQAIREERLQSKRKANPLANISSKKVRSVGTAESPVDGTSSFGASGLEIK